MLLNITYNDPEIKHKIDDQVGKAFSLRERFKMGGIGSPKMKITKSSIEIYNLLQLDQNSNTCNVELRPKGIIIGFQKRLEIYALVIPYYKLNLYKGDTNAYTFFKDHHKIRVHAGTKDTKIHRFIQRILKAQDNQRPTQLEYL